LHEEYSGPSPFRALYVVKLNWTILAPYFENLSGEDKENGFFQQDGATAMQSKINGCLK